MLPNPVATRYVVDASVGIKLIVAEPLADRAASLLHDSTTDALNRLHVPDLVYVECANIPWKYVRRHGMPAQVAQDGLDTISRLSLVGVPTAVLVEDALPIALRYQLSAYDACYAALSGQVSIPLVTADEALVRKRSSSPFDVRWLGDPSFA